MDLTAANYYRILIARNPNPCKKYILMYGELSNLEGQCGNPNDLSAFDKLEKQRDMAKIDIALTATFGYEKEVTRNPNRSYLYIDAQGKKHEVSIEYFSRTNHKQVKIIGSPDLNPKNGNYPDKMWIESHELFMNEDGEKRAQFTEDFIERNLLP